MTRIERIRKELRALFVDIPLAALFVLSLFVWAVWKRILDRIR